MTTTVLTDEQIAQALNLSGATDYADVPLSYDLEIARAIEQAVLQSPEIQALRKDAELWQFFIGNYDEYGTVGYIDAANLKADIDAAMEKQT